ncbi:MAG: 2Fe-2S iron-sulfur cluster binding domain-containing protein [Glaciimonas sp.]|nr:2Fe-2S iron-sulfur cluster binding domain-containing protein [Glaciimonas sp.]
MSAHFSVVITPQGWEFDTPDTHPLLVSAQLAGVRLPSSCRNGTCRTCICRLLRGRVSYRIEWPGLSAEEKADGFILPCVAYAESNLVIDIPNAVRHADVS